jgi:hypothetical protein
MAATAMVMNGPQLRRSPRIDRCIPVRVLGEKPDGQRVDEPAEANQVSTHGVRMTIATALPTGCVVEVQNPENQRGARYRVVWAIEAGSEASWQMGLELVSGDPSFWGIEFPPPDD